MDIANAAAVIFSQNGLAVGLIAVGIAAGWYVCQWLAKNVVKPLMAAHTRFLDRLAICLEDNTRLLSSLDDRSFAQLQINREQFELIKEIHRHAMSGKDRKPPMHRPDKPAVHEPESPDDRG